MASDVSLSTVDSIPSSDANVDVPYHSSELLNTSLDTSLTPKAESCGADICSTTLVEETVEAVVANGHGVVDDLKPLSPQFDEYHDGCADNANDDTVDVPDDQFFPASEGTVSFCFLLLFYALSTLCLKKRHCCSTL